MIIYRVKIEKKTAYVLNDIHSLRLMSLIVERPFGGRNQLRLSWMSYDEWSKMYHISTLRSALCGSQPIGRPGVAVEFHQTRLVKIKAHCLK
jgi:hypothetical protein